MRGTEAKDTKVGEIQTVGNGYYIKVHEEILGKKHKSKRWVLYDSHDRRVLNAPVFKFTGQVLDYYNTHLKNKKTSSPSAESVDKKLEEAEKKIEESLQNQKGLTDEQRKGLEDQYSFLQALNAESRRTGKKARDIVLEWDSNPELRPEGLREANWNDKIFNYLYSMAGSDKNIEGLEDTIKQGQEARQGVVDKMYDLNQPSMPEYLGMMTSEVPSYQNLWGTLSEDQQDEMTPDQLRMLQREKELDKAKQQSFGFADLFTSMAPKEGEINLKHTDPSYDAVKSVWDRDYMPNYQYNYTGPYNQREHELAAAGHAKGSSSIMGNAEARRRAMRMEDLDAMTKLQNMFRSGNQGNREIIDSVDALSRAQRGAAFEPIKAEADIIGKDLQRQDDNAYRDKVFAKDIAQGEMSNINAEMQENASLYNVLEQQRMQELQQYQGLANEIYQYGILAQDFDKLSGEQKAQFANLQEQLWQNRLRIIEMMKQAGRAQEAFELEQAANDKAAFMQKVVLGAKIAGTIAAIAAQQPQLAVALWAPEAASFMNQGFGGSAKAGPKEG